MTLGLLPQQKVGYEFYSTRAEQARSRQQVKIEHEERVAATSELNPTPSLATD